MDQNLISLVNKLQRACTALGDQGDETALPSLWDSLPAIAVIGGQVRLYLIFFRSPKKSSFGESFALASALEQETIGNELNKGELKSRDGFVKKVCIDVKDTETVVDDVEEVLKNMEDLPLPVYSSMIRGFGLDKRLDLLGAVKQTEKYAEVEKIMEDIRVEGVCPNVVTYNTLMSIYVEQGHPRKALSVLEEILEKGLSPSPVSYSTALLCYRRMEDGNGALKFFLELREIYQNGEIGKDTLEEDWVEEFVKFENFTIRICNQVMLRWLIKRTPLTTDVLKLLMEMVQMDKAGLRSGRAEYERLIWACTHEGYYTAAKKLYNKIREHESEINLSVCNHVIWLMGKSKKWWAALEI
ncbi:hypothetical protein GIB67_017846 [Kingdonia uniflora]|uniref:Pentatricopeptide repeat-containing protein n=1 Tax=Kingdonia uniflora TaxID=39325 RepID=A0A7J7NTR9_9MAGN|nr:hypothetical protein GIB67_017846 [Kingdonia uniflora]